MVYYVYKQFEIEGCDIYAAWDAASTSHVTSTPSLSSE